MTSASMLRDRLEAAPSEAARRTVWIHALIGLSQGIGLWMLQQALEHGSWPATSGPWYGACLYLALSLPVAWYLSNGCFATLSRRTVFVLVLGALFAMLGAHAGRTLDTSPLWRPLPDHLVATGVLGFVLVALVCGFDAAQRRFNYERLFELAWRNGVLIPVSALLTGLFWILLWAGAWLLESIGLQQLRKLLQQPSFAFVATGGAFGLTTGLTLVKADMLRAVRRFSLSLTTWLLPLAMCLAVVWVGALPFTGLKKLFATRNAAFYLFWFCTLCICFTNAAFQDGREHPGYPRWLARTLVWACLALVPLTLVADWALWERVRQHGWTPGRIWATAVGLLVTIHALGYAISLRKRTVWMSNVPRTNVAAAMVKVAIVVLLISPLADVRKLSVNSQISRLSSGAVSVEAFDWDFLRLRSGPYGREALRALAHAPGQDPHSRQIAQRAERAMNEPAPGPGPPRQERQAALTALRQQVAMIPKGAQPDGELMEWLARETADWDERGCLAVPPTCALWWTDLDGDGKTDAVLLWEHDGRVQATLYAKEQAGWRKQGSLRNRMGNLADWITAINTGPIERMPARWPDLKIGGMAVTMDR